MACLRCHRRARSFIMVLWRNFKVPVSLNCASLPRKPRPWRGLPPKRRRELRDAPAPSSSRTLVIYRRYRTFFEHLRLKAATTLCREPASRCCGATAVGRVFLLREKRARAPTQLRALKEDKVDDGGVGKKRVRGGRVFRGSAPTGDTALRWRWWGAMTRRSVEVNM